MRDKLKVNPWVKPQNRFFVLPLHNLGGISPWWVFSSWPPGHLASSAPLNPAEPRMCCCFSSSLCGWTPRYSLLFALFLAGEPPLNQTEPHQTTPNQYIPACVGLQVPLRDRSDAKKNQASQLRRLFFSRQSGPAVPGGQHRRTENSKTNKTKQNKTKQNKHTSSLQHPPFLKCLLRYTQKLNGTFRFSGAGLFLCVNYSFSGGCFWDLHSKTQKTNPSGRRFEIPRFIFASIT